jgi:hypothetical protein
VGTAARIANRGERLRSPLGEIFDEWNRPSASRVSSEYFHFTRRQIMALLLYRRLHYVAARMPGTTWSAFSVTITWGQCPGCTSPLHLGQYSRGYYSKLLCARCGYTFILPTVAFWQLGLEVQCGCGALMEPTMLKKNFGYRCARCGHSTPLGLILPLIDRTSVHHPQPGAR